MVVGITAYFHMPLFQDVESKCTANFRIWDFHFCTQLTLIRYQMHQRASNFTTFSHFWCIRVQLKRIHATKYLWRVFADFDFKSQYELMCKFVEINFKLKCIKSPNHSKSKRQAKQAAHNAPIKIVYQSKRFPNVKMIIHIIKQKYAHKIN